MVVSIPFTHILIIIDNKCYFISRNLYISRWNYKINYCTCKTQNYVKQRFVIGFSHLLFQSTPCKHPVIVLQDVAWTDLHALVEFIYHGEVNVHQRSLSSFLKTAEVLRVSGLTQQHGDDRESVIIFHSFLLY